MQITLISSQDAYENWSYENPVTQGIGGSETSHIELAWRLAKRGHQVVSYAPVAWGGEREWRGTTWSHYRNADYSRPGLWLLYRDPRQLDHFPWKHPGQTLLYIAQDTAYPEGTVERYARLDKYVCLCRDHAIDTEKRWPSLKGRIAISRNGIKSDEIREVLSEGIVRHPRRMIYCSSPDRGLRNLAVIFSRVHEYHQDAELHCFYGFNNIDSGISASSKANAYVWGKIKSDIEKAIDQPGIFWHGRISQPELHREMAKSAIFCYPTAFSETGPLSGDTLVETLTGPIRIDELVGKEFHVYSCSSIGGLSVSKAKNVRCTRQNEPVLKVTLKPAVGRNSGQEKHLILTPDHRVMLRDGSYVKAGNLRIGDRVKAFHARKNGWGLGYRAIGITGQEIVPEHRFVAELKLGRKLKEDEVVDHVNGNKSDNRFDNLEAKTQAQHALDHVNRMTEADRSAMLISLTAGALRMTTQQKSAAAKKAWAKRKRLSNHVVTKIEEYGSRDVYCMEVDPDHNFVANGIVVHNCIANMEAQALGAIPVTNPYWALRDYCTGGIHIEGNPNYDLLVRARYVGELIRLMSDDGIKLQEQIRKPMIKLALEQFDWDGVAEQLEGMVTHQVAEEVVGVAV